MPLSTTLDTVGPLTRCVEDAALVYAAIRGPDPLHPPTLHHPVDDPLATLRDGVKDMRLAALPDSEREMITPAVLAAYEQSLDALQSLGATVLPIELPQSFATYRDASSTLISAEGYSETCELVDRDDLALDQHVRERMLPGRSVSAKDYLHARRQIETWRAEFLASMSDIDALLTPTSAMTAIPVAEVDESAIPAYFTRATNILGWCALSMPNGYDDAGMPTSLCIHGQPFQEAEVLRIGWALEQATAADRRTPAGLI